MNEDMMTEAERASIAADGTDGLLGKRGKGVFHIHTLGCQMNVHDSERIAGVLEADGYVPATEEQYLDHDVDLIVLCGTRERSRTHVWHHWPIQSRQTGSAEPADRRWRLHGPA